MPQLALGGPAPPLVAVAIAVAIANDDCDNATALALARLDTQCVFLCPCRCPCLASFVMGLVCLVAQVQRMLMSGVTRAFGRWCAYVDEIYENRAKMTKIVLQLQRLASKSTLAGKSEKTFMLFLTLFFFFF